MKQHIFSISFFLISIAALSQGVLIGSESADPDPAAILEVRSRRGPERSMHPELPAICTTGLPQRTATPKPIW